MKHHNTSFCALTSLRRVWDDQKHFNRDDYLIPWSASTVMFDHVSITCVHILAAR
jgi:hypothetical protein